MTSETNPTHPSPDDVPPGEAESLEESCPERKGPPPPSRDELLRVRDRDPDALGRLFDHYFPTVYGLVFRLLGNRMAAEDATQEVLIKVHRAADRLDPDRDPGPWLTTIAYNVCRDRWRSVADRMDRQSASIDDEPDFARRLAHGGPDPEEKALAGERERLVQEALDRLPDEAREVIVLHDYQGLGHDEVAKILGVSHAAIRKRYSRALVALGKILKETMDA